MVPASPQRVTIGTGERSIRPTVVVTEVGHALIGPSLVLDQSKADMASVTTPPPARKERTPETLAMHAVAKNPTLSIRKSRRARLGARRNVKVPPLGKFRPRGRSGRDRRCGVPARWLSPLCERSACASGAPTATTTDAWRTRGDASRTLLSVLC